MDTFSRHLASLHAAAVDVQQQLRDLQSENNALQTQNTALLEEKKELHTLKAENTQLRAKLKSLEASLEKLTVSKPEAKQVAPIEQPKAKESVLATKVQVDTPAELKASDAEAQVPLVADDFTGEVIDLKIAHPVKGGALDIRVPGNASVAIIKQACAAALGQPNVVKQGRLAKRSNQGFTTLKDTEMLRDQRKLFLMGVDDFQTHDYKPVLSMQQAIKLQEDLISGFSTSTFQRRMDELDQQHINKDTLEYMKAKRDLVLEVQLVYLPAYMFAPDLKGVGRMVIAFQEIAFPTDPQIVANGEKIAKLIRSPVPKAQVVEKMAESRATSATSLQIPPAKAPVPPPQLKAPAVAAEGPGALTRPEAIALQLDLEKRFREPSFQQKLFALETNPGREAKHFRSIRTKLIRSVQFEVLPKYGLEGSNKGVLDMMARFQEFDNDAEISIIGGRLNKLLGLADPPQPTAVTQAAMQAAAQAPPAAQEQKPTERGNFFVVTGGGKQGGLVVRRGKELHSPELERLGTGAVVKELERHGERMFFKKKEGEGPEYGWISLHIKGADTIRPA